MMMQEKLRNKQDKLKDPMVDMTPSHCSQNLQFSELGSSPYLKRGAGELSSPNSPQLANPKKNKGCLVAGSQTSP